MMTQHPTELVELLAPDAPPPEPIYYFTNAPEAYDYWYVTTVTQLEGCNWRLVEVRDQERFEACQGPRYLSGWHAYVEADTEEAMHLGLPLRAELDGVEESS